MGTANCIGSDHCRSWFSQDLAVYDANTGKVLASGMDSAGFIQLLEIDFVNSIVRGARPRITIIEADDHDAAGICVLDNGKYAIGYTQHQATPAAKWTNVSSNAGDITTWGSEVSWGSDDDVYSRLRQFGDTNKSLWDVFRDGTVTAFHPAYYRVSTDHGATWTAAPGNPLWANSTNDFPSYGHCKIDPGNNRKIHFVFITKFPTVVNKLYHFYAIVDATTGIPSWFTSGGGAVSTGHLSSAITPAILDAVDSSCVVYDGTTFPAWTFDISFWGGNPVIGFAVFKDPPGCTTHEHWISTWSGSAWTAEKVCNVRAAGSGPDYLLAAQVVYSPGIALDPNTTNQVYVSRGVNGTGSASPPTQFQIERWSKSGTWSQQEVITGSGGIDFRPVCPVGLNPTRCLFLGTGGTYAGSAGAYTDFNAGYRTGLWSFPAVNLLTGKGGGAPILNTNRLPYGCKFILPLSEGSGTPIDLTATYACTTVGSPTWGSDATGAYMAGWSTSNYVKFDSLASAWGTAAFPKWASVTFRNTDSATYSFLMSLGNSGDSNPTLGFALNFGGTSNLVGLIFRDSSGSQSSLSGTYAASSDGNLHSLTVIAYSTTLWYLFFDDIGVQSGTAPTLSTWTLDSASLGVLRRNTIDAHYSVAKIYMASFGWGAAPEPKTMGHQILNSQFMLWPATIVPSPLSAFVHQHIPWQVMNE